jgi:hypothetical protein
MRTHRRICLNGCVDNDSLDGPFLRAANSERANAFACVRGGDAIDAQRLKYDVVLPRTGSRTAAAAAACENEAGHGARHVYIWTTPSARIQCRLAGNGFEIYNR